MPVSSRFVCNLADLYIYIYRVEKGATCKGEGEGPM